jgi:organic radical activating enzyme
MSFIGVIGMNYSVEEIFYTLQGEGARAGRPAVFCRFSGCNLWSGRETNGTLAVHPGIDWICVSPKAGAPWVQRHGQELKLVFPQVGLMPGEIGDLDFENYLLQPLGGI